jgi:hypothetical protein
MSEVRRGRLTSPGYFADLDFFVAAHRAFSVSEIFFLAAADITLFFAGTDFFAETDVVRPADFFCDSGLFAGTVAVVPGGDTPCKSESRIFVRRSISLFSSATAPVMLIFPPVNLVEQA